jgi:hypothetical protein
MPVSDAEVVAMLADMEALRVEASHAHELLAAERERRHDLTDQVRRLDGFLASAMERQRELHVLLLHRDEELAALRKQGRPTDDPTTAERPAVPTPRRAVAAPTLRQPTWEAVLANVWYRFTAAASRIGNGRRPEGA